MFSYDLKLFLFFSCHDATPRFIESASTLRRQPRQARATRTPSTSCATPSSWPRGLVRASASCSRTSSSPESNNPETRRKTKRETPSNVWLVPTEICSQAEDWEAAFHKILLLPCCRLVCSVNLWTLFCLEGGKARQAPTNSLLVESWKRKKMLS